MIKAVLLDLDNTLLNNADRVFAAEYMRLVDMFFQEHWGYPDMSASIRQMIKHVSGPHDFQLSNTENAVRLIAEATGRSADAISQAYRIFYADSYPQLQQYTQANPLSAVLVDYLLQRQYAVVIATNPLFSDDAIRQRIAWAGIPDTLAAQVFITSSDNMHFAKPDPAYYAEIIARVGVEPDEALMVGDQRVNDIQPARQIGLHTFHITDDDPAPEADHYGTLADFFYHLRETNWLDTLLPHPLQITAIEPEMRGNMGALFGLLSEVKAHQWQQHPDPEEWSIIQIVCHLLESEEKVQQPRLKHILNEDNPFLVSPQPPPGPREAIPCDTNGLPAARCFLRLRQETLAWLAQLDEADWQRPARHSIFGNTNLLEMAHFTAQHDRLHINQICQTLGRCE